MNDKNADADVEAKTRFDQFRQLAELAASRFDQRRNYEWKLTLGLWATMLATAFPPVEEPPKLHPLFSAVFLVGIVTVYWYWIGNGIWLANQSDKARYEYFRNKAEEILGTLPPDLKRNLRDTSPEKVKWCSKCAFGDWNTKFQILVTAAIAILVGISICQRHADDKSKSNGQRSKAEQVEHVAARSRASKSCGGGATEILKPKKTPVPFNFSPFYCSRPVKWLPLLVDR
jgi:hypothetical protein